MVELVKQHCDCSAHAARQRIKRASESNDIWRSDALRLEHNQRLYSLTRPSFDSDEAMADLIRLLNNTSRKGLVRCLNFLGEKKILNILNLCRLMAVPLEDTKRARPLQGSRTFVKQIMGIGELGYKLIQENTHLEAYCHHKTRNKDAKASGAFAELRSEALISRFITERFERENFTSWQSSVIATANEPYVTFNEQVYTAYAFSYLSPLIRWNKKSTKPIPMPVLFD